LKTAEDSDITVFSGEISTMLKAASINMINLDQN